MTNEQIQSEITYPDRFYNMFGLSFGYKIELPNVIIYHESKTECQKLAVNIAQAFIQPTTIEELEKTRQIPTV